MQILQGVTIWRLATSVGIVLGLIYPASASAQASRLGPTFSIPGVPSVVKRRPDIAYDSVNDVYLVVTGTARISGTFVSPTGAAIGAPFDVASTGAYVQTPRVAFSPNDNAFLVTWLDGRVDDKHAQVWGRLIRYVAGGPVPLTGDFLISTAPGGAHSEMGPAVAYGAVSRLFLVVWMQYGPSNGGQLDIRAQRVDATGALAGGEIVITNDPFWQAEPSVGYNPNLDEFYVAFSGEIGTAYIGGQRVAAATGSLVGSPIVLQSGVFLTIPEVQFNPRTGRYLVAWFQGPAPSVLGVQLNGDGSAAGGVFPIAAGFGSYDSLDVAYNVGSDTFLAVFHDRNSLENLGLQISGTGVPDSPFVATGSGGNIGNFNPRLDARPNPSNREWLMTSARDFNQTVGQLIHTASVPPGPPPPPPPPPPDTMTLSISPAPTGGAVTSNPAGITCGADCTNPYADSTSVVLTPLPSAGGAFAGWGGDADCMDGTVTMSANRTCTAFFTSVSPNQKEDGVLDFNGDQGGDAFRYDPVTGEWAMGLGRTFGSSAGTWSAGWSIQGAEFNNDGRTDLFLYNPTTGDWFKATSDGLGDFNYFGGNWGVGWTATIGEFNGDSVEDVFLYKKSTGEWALGISALDGKADVSFILGTWSPGWTVYPLDLTFDGVTDLFLYNSVTGAWYRAHTTHAGFDYVGGSWSPGWQIYPGDFNADGVDDLFLYNAAGVWYVAANAGPGFTYAGGQWSAGWEIDVGELNGDGRDDLFLYNRTTGDWFEAFSNGAGNFTFAGGTWWPNWEFHLTDFNADGRKGVLVYNPATGAWVKGVNTGPGTFATTSGTWSPNLTILTTKSR